MVDKISPVTDAQFLRLHRRFTSPQFENRDPVDKKDLTAKFVHVERYYPTRDMVLVTYRKESKTKVRARILSEALSDHVKLMWLPRGKPEVCPETGWDSHVPDEKDITGVILSIGGDPDGSGFIFMGYVKMNDTDPPLNLNATLLFEYKKDEAEDETIHRHLVYLSDDHLNIRSYQDSGSNHKSARRRHDIENICDGVSDVNYSQYTGLEKFSLRNQKYDKITTEVSQMNISTDPDKPDRWKNQKACSGEPISGQTIFTFREQTNQLIYDRVVVGDKSYIYQKKDEKLELGYGGLVGEAPTIIKLTDSNITIQAPQLVTIKAPLTVIDGNHHIKGSCTVDGSCPMKCP